MKTNIELICNEDGSFYINFWNYLNGEDVICEIENGKSFLWEHDTDGNIVKNKEINIIEFCNMVKEKLKEIETS